MNEILIMLGKRIAELRVKRGLTQEQLTEMIDYSTNHISKLELARTNPSFDLLVGISRVLNIELKDLFDFDGYKEVNYAQNKLEELINSKNADKIKLLYKIYCSLDV